MAKHFTPEFKLEAAKLVVDHGYTYVFGVHRSSYRHWQASANEPDGERVTKRSQVIEAWNASGGSAGARSIATIVSRDSGVKMRRWLAQKNRSQPNRQGKTGRQA